MKPETRWWIYRKGSAKRREVLDRLRRERERAAEEARRRARAEKKARRVAEIRRLWSGGMEGKEIARKFKLSRSTVSFHVSDLPRSLRVGCPEDIAWPYPRREADLATGPTRRAVAPRVPRGPAPVGERDRLPAHRPCVMRGSAHGRAKVTEADVSRLKALRAEGRTHPELAREFGLSLSSVDNILSGRTWGHVPPATGGNAR